MCDDVQGSASAQGTGSVECGRLVFVQQCDEILSCGTEVSAAKGQCLAAVAVGEQSEVTDLYEASRQHVEQEAADELGRIKPHRAASVVVSRITPAEAYLSVLEAE